MLSTLCCRDYRPTVHFTPPSILPVFTLVPLIYHDVMTPSCGELSMPHVTLHASSHMLWSTTVVMVVVHVHVVMVMWLMVMWFIVSLIPDEYFIYLIWPELKQLLFHLQSFDSYNNNN